MDGKPSVITMTQDAMLEALAEAYHETDDNTMTSREMSVALGLSSYMVTKRIREAIKRGLLEPCYAMKRNVHGEVRTVKAYAWIGNGEEEIGEIDDNPD